MTELAWTLVICVIGIVLVLNFTPDRTPPDLDRMNDEERAKHLDAKRRRALAKMKAYGIRSILDGKPYANATHEAPSLRKKAELHLIRRNA